MTRARRSLAALTEGRHPFLRAESDAVLRRVVAPDASALSQSRQLYQSADPERVDLSFARRLRVGNPSLAAIERAQEGDPVTLMAEGEG